VNESRTNEEPLLESKHGTLHRRRECGTLLKVAIIVSLFVTSLKCSLSLDLLIIVYDKYVTCFQRK